MSAPAEIVRQPAGLAAPPAGPCVGIVTPHKATYLKPLYEAFAAAQPDPWGTLIVWPAAHRSEHPAELVTPVARNLRIEEVGGQRSFRGRFLPSGVAAALTAAAPRAVMIQEYSPFSLAALWHARRRRIPVVVMTEVGQGNRGFFDVRTRLWHGFWARWVDGIAAACPAAHQPLGRRRPPSVAVYHAVDARVYRPMERTARGPVTFAAVGRVIPRKGLDLWIEAARLLRASGHEQFRLRIIGDGDDSWLRRVISSAGLDDKVEWSGFLSGTGLREALGSADVFVLPTRRDTYAAVVHEAACLGLPLLVSRHAGAADALVRDGGNGFVIDPADARDFALRMRFLLDGKLRHRMAEVSREIGMEFSAHHRGAALWQWMSDQFSLVAR